MQTRRCVICVVRDVTERVQREKEIRARSLQQEAVASLSQRGLEGIDLLSLMNETVILVARILDVEYSKILELLPDGKSLFLRAGAGWKHGLVGTCDYRCRITFTSWLYVTFPRTSIG